jgi:peptidoglycan/xylan/chitin deacetylase (PgdA/CDA1 family)
MTSTGSSRRSWPTRPTANKTLIGARAAAGTLAPRVFELPDHLAQRRADVRARQRRNRRARVAAAAVSVAAAAALVLLVIAPAAGPPRHAGAPPLKLNAIRPGPAPRLRGLTPAELANLRRLIALGRPVYCGGRHGHAVAFTFDDGPGVYTHYALRKLRRAHERATFFVVGKSIRAWPGWLRPEARVAALGDHTMTHQDLLAMSPRQAYEEIAPTQQLIQRDSGERVELFRPPYGAQDRTIEEIVRRLGMIDVMWSVDSADSLGANYAGIIRNVEHGLRPGAIIEMHENRGQTIRALTTLLPVLRRRHLQSVSVVTLLATDPPTDAQVRRGEGACGAPTQTPGRGVE